MKVARIILIILISVNLNSCTKKVQRNQGFIKPIKLVIPAELKDDSEVFDFIVQTEKNVNEFSDNIEIVVLKGHDVISKNQDNLTIMEGLEAAKVMLEFYSNCTELQNTIDDFDDYIIELKSSNDFTEEQLIGMEDISNTFKNRLGILESKYKTFYKR